LLLAGFHGRVNQSLASLALVLKRPAGNANAERSQPDDPFPLPLRSARDPLLAGQVRQLGQLWPELSTNVQFALNLHVNAAKRLFGKRA